MVPSDLRLWKRSSRCRSCRRVGSALNRPTTMRTASSDENAVAGTSSWLPCVHLVCRLRFEPGSRCPFGMGWSPRGCQDAVQSLPDPEVLCGSFLLLKSLSVKGRRCLHGVEKNQARFSFSTITRLSSPSAGRGGGPRGTAPRRPGRRPRPWRPRVVVPLGNGSARPARPAR